MTDVRQFQMPCGMRVVMERVASRAVYLGLIVKAGTRHELPAESGLAHFVEHMTFKGTTRRTARQLTGILERRGGELGAYTSKQETVYYANVMPEDFMLAADVLCDMVFCSTYPQEEMAKEVEVICDEIESYHDSPAELIFDDFESRLFSDEALGRDILGQPDVLRQYVSADLQAFAARHYRPENCVCYVVGDIDFSSIEDVLTKAINLTPYADERRNGEFATTQAEDRAVLVNTRSLGNLKSRPTFSEKVDKFTHQSHVLYGTTTFGYHHPQVVCLQFLNNILGGPAPNSRFNLMLRERSGLVYSVDSYVTLYEDVGTWMVYFGCDHHQAEKCLQLLRREIDKIIACEINSATFCRLQQQFIRQIRLSADNFENYALAQGKSVSRTALPRDIDTLCARIEAITPAQLRAVAAEWLSAERMSTLIYYSSQES